MTKQLATLSSYLTKPTQPPRQCFNCGRLARNCYSRRTAQCFNCVLTGHVARTAGIREMDKRVPRSLEQGEPRRLVSAHTTMHAPHTSTHTYIVLATTHNPYTNRVAHTYGSLNNGTTLILLDSGASCSVISRSHVNHTPIKPTHRVRLVNADGRDITPCGVATVTIGLGKFSAEHKFVVVDHLSHQ